MSARRERALCVEAAGANPVADRLDADAEAFCHDGDAQQPLRAIELRVGGDERFVSLQPYTIRRTLPEGGE